MTAATKERSTEEIAHGRLRAVGLAAAAKIYGGTIAALDAAGAMVKGTTTTVGRVLGVALKTWDNSTGAAGAVTGEAHVGIFGPFANSTAGDLIAAADVGATCYVVDDSTVAKTNGTNTRLAAGTVWAVDASGVWVKFS